MIAYDIRHIYLARRSGLALMAASGMDFFKNETLSYANRCCHQGSPLSPRQRYVRSQSEQQDNQVFPEIEVSISPRKRAILSGFSRTSICKIGQMLSSPILKMLICRLVPIFIVKIRKIYSQAAQVWLRKHLWSSLL